MIKLNLVKNKLVENILSLLTLKGAEYILALITLPYLVRVLGPERFGAIAFMQGIVQYFIILVDYGFNITAPRDIARTEGTSDMGKVFSTIIITKLLLCLVGSSIFFFCVMLFQQVFVFDFKLFLAAYCSVIGNIIFPIWFFQGIQQMRYITIANITARAFSVIAIFTLVRLPGDYVLAAFFQALAPVVAGIISIGIVFLKFPGILVVPTVMDIWKMLKAGWDVFISTVAISAYTASNIVILGMFTNNTIVGYFSGANKIIESIKGLLAPFSQAIYPHVCKLAEESNDMAIAFLKKVLFGFGGGMLFFSLLLFIGAGPIVHLLLGKFYEPSIALLRIMAFLPFIIALSNVFGIQTMLPFGMEHLFSRILLTSAVVNICMVFPLTYLYQSVGLCSSMVITELFVTVVMGGILHKRGILV